MLCISEGEIVMGKPNTAVIVYDLQHSVTKILESSRRDKRGTLWQRKSIMAHTIDKKGPVTEFFATQIVPELGSQSESEEEISDVDETETQSTYSDAEGSTPPAKRRRTEDGGISTSSFNIYLIVLKDPYPYFKLGTTASHTWMQAQIVRLEEELNNAQNQCDRATLQLDEARRARDEATRHKDKIDAELARERAKNGQLHLELVGAHAYQLALMNDVNTLRGQLSAFEESARQVQPTVGESERVKALEQELEEAHDHAQK
ncbi:unnamed protein product [Rhizoctonia solani]|uniref:Uncharacterized protein n=1 Tax=Rhizoctonia solani TaxID=456999 RepID=A0A8H3E7J8_9AGAM|nr:unnamed protein product [Rhizoctonia solani]